MENFENEIWKDIHDYEGLYMVSNLGRVKSLDRIEEYSSSGRFRRRKGRILTQKIDFGYCRVILCKNSTNQFYRVNRLVWETFNGDIPEGMDVNHINEVKTDNRLSNLNLMTRKENCNWGTRNKRISKQIKKPVTQILNDGTEFYTWFSATDASNGNGSYRRHITQCCKGKRRTAGGYRWRYAKEGES